VLNLLQYFFGGPTGTSVSAPAPAGLLVLTGPAGETAAAALALVGPVVLSAAGGAVGVTATAGGVDTTAAATPGVFLLVGPAAVIAGGALAVSAAGLAAIVGASTVGVTAGAAAPAAGGPPWPIGPGPAVAAGVGADITPGQLAWLLPVGPGPTVTGNSLAAGLAPGVLTLDAGAAAALTGVTLAARSGLLWPAAGAAGLAVGASVGATPGFLWALGTPDGMTQWAVAPVAPGVLAVLGVTPGPAAAALVRAAAGRLDLGAISPGVFGEPDPAVLVAGAAALAALTAFGRGETVACEFRYSAPAAPAGNRQAQPEPDESRGGWVSTTPWAGAKKNDLVGPVSAADNQARRPAYRCLFVVNTSPTETLPAASAYLADQAGGCAVALAVDPTPAAHQDADPAQALAADPGRPPAGVHFRSAAGPANALALGRLPPGHARAVWLRVEPQGGPAGEATVLLTAAGVAVRAVWDVAA
jgi:hypothetical protein